MDTIRKTISVIEPVQEAIGKTRTLLFKPFDAEKWMAIGFCAWLANLLREGIRGTTNFNFKNTQMNPESAKILDYIRDHIVAVSVGAAVAVTLILAIVVLCLWLSSRGQFMFLDCLAKNRAQIKQPWQTFKQRANSLFGFRLILMVTGFFVITALSIPIIFFAIAATSSTSIAIAAIAMIFVMVFFVFIAACFLGLVQTLTFDFVVPIMYLQNINVFAAWRKFLPVLKDYFWKLMLYMIFKVLIRICIGSIVLFIVLAGCCFCCISVILFIPYIGTVVLLPFPSFIRFYSLCFLRQIGSQYDVFAATA